jgi:tyrosine-protein kinase Etk/Wzc
MNKSPDISFLRPRAAQKRIAVVTLACVVGAGVYAFVAPKWYSSSVTVVPVKAPTGGGALAGLIGGAAAGLASGFVESAMGGPDSARIAAVLQSAVVTDAVIDKFDLRTRYDQKYQETTREELWRHCSVKALPKPNLVQLSCEDRDPKFVQQMLAYFAEYGNQVFRRVSSSSASEEARFLEKRVQELRQQADDAADRMRAFQEQHRIVDLDTQAKAVVSSLATLNAQRITKQLELDYARTFSSDAESTNRQLESQLSVVGRKLRDLEVPTEPDGASSQRSTGPGRGMFPAALEVPKLRAEFETLLRDRKVAEATLIFALERLEGAKATEARDVSTFQVLDPPPLPTRKSRPKRGVIIAVFAVLGFGFAVGREAWSAGTLQALLGMRSAAARAGAAAAGVSRAGTA